MSDGGEYVRVALRQMRAACPRCGYDQRGGVATWSESCPLEGICTECGLHITWSEVLQPEKFEPRWCVEFVSRIWRMPRASMRTLIRSFWPWGFWSRLKMSHSIRPLRLLIYILWLLLLPLLCYVPIQAGVAMYVRYQTAQMLAQAFARLPTSIQQMQATIQAMQSTSPSDPQVAAMQQKQILIMQQQIARMKAIKSPAKVECSYAWAVFEAVCMPLAQDSYGTISSGSAIYPYTPPDKLWDTALQISSFRWRSGSGQGRAFSVPMISLFSWFAFGLTLMVLLPASFILLPVSRRRAKVRWSHIGRVAAYGLAIPVSAVVACAGLFVMGALLESSARSFHTWMIIVIGAGMPITLTLWWGAAIGGYMKIPHGHFTAFLLMILCALLILAGIWLIVPGVLVG